MKVEEYHYFVSYMFMQGKSFSYGCCEVTLGKAITTYSEVLNIMNGIKKNNGFDIVVILNYVFLRREFKNE